MSRVEERVFTDKLAALRYNREQAGQFFEATVPGAEHTKDALEFVCKAISGCEVAKSGSRADALLAIAPDILSRCRKAMDTDKKVYVVAVSRHAAQIALVAHLMGLTKWNKKQQDEQYIAALEAETDKTALP